MSDGWLPISTWHHWMNINLTDLEVAGGTNWEKIKRYYLNLAVWLAPPHIPRHCFYFHVVESLFAYPGIEEFHPKADLIEIGVAFRHYLLRLYGPCWVTHFVIDWIAVIDVQLRERLIERYLAVPMPKRPFPPRPDPCSTCPPPDLIEAAILGGVVRAAAQAIRGDRGGIEASIERLRETNPDKLEKQFAEGAAAGVKHLQAQYATSLQQTKTLLG